MRKVESINVDPMNPHLSHFSGIKQIIRITREFTSNSNFSKTSHVVYAICTRGLESFSASDVAQTLRKHWTIEIRLHGQRDVRMKEDANKTKTGAAPRALACLRNWAIAVVEQFYQANSYRRISQAWRAFRFNTDKAIAMLG